MPREVGDVFNPQSFRGLTHHPERIAIAEAERAAHAQVSCRERAMERRVVDNILIRQNLLLQGSRIFRVDVNFVRQQRVPQQPRPAEFLAMHDHGAGRGGEPRGEIREDHGLGELFRADANLLGRAFGQRRGGDHGQDRREQKPFADMFHPCLACATSAWSFIAARRHN